MQRSEKEKSSIEVRATMRIQNLAIVRARESMGVTVHELCSRARIAVDTYYSFVRFDAQNWHSKSVEAAAYRLAATLCIDLDDVMPPDLIGQHVRSRASIDMTVDAPALLSMADSQKMLTSEPIEAASASELSDILNRAIDDLPRRHRRVIQGRMRGETLGEIGRALNISAERARTIEMGAVERLRHDKRLGAVCVDRGWIEE